MIYATDFSHLPEVSFTERDTGKVEAGMIALYEYFTKRTLYPGNPERLFITTLAAMFAQRNVIIDDTGKQNLLRYARKAMLDQVGAMLGVYRLAATFAVTTMRFAPEEAVDYPVPIPANTRVTADSDVYFETLETAVLLAGQTSMVLPVRALTAGAAGNGLEPGRINRLCDHLDVEMTVANLETTAGGAEVEEDESFRDRIHMAPEKFTTAGSELSYVYHARSARPGIADVAVDSPNPGDVHLYILLDGGVIPEEDGPELADVRAAVSHEKVRPLTDHVLVKPGVPVELDYDFTYYITKQQAAYEDIIAANVKKAAAGYERWQTGKLGLDINPDELVRACRAAGAKRIEPRLIIKEIVPGESGEEAQVVETAVPLAFTRLSRMQVAKIPERVGRVRSGGVEEE